MLELLVHDTDWSYWHDIHKGNWRTPEVGRRDWNEEMLELPVQLERGHHARHAWQAGEGRRLADRRKQTVYTNYKPFCIHRGNWRTLELGRRDWNEEMLKLLVHARQPGSESTSCSPRPENWREQTASPPPASWRGQMAGRPERTDSHGRIDWSRLMLVAISTSAPPRVHSSIGKTARAMLVAIHAFLVDASSTKRLVAIHEFDEMALEFDRQDGQGLRHA